MIPRDLIVELYGRRIVVPQPSDLATRRWLGLLSPEPETIAWIEEMAPGEVLYDVGASVGTHSIRAASRGVRVEALEPCAEEYSELVTTSCVNDLQPFLRAHQVAAHCEDGAGYFVPGRSERTVLLVGERDQTVLPKRHVLCRKLDTLARNLQLWPTRIKIDVDGNELDVLNGAEACLALARSVLIEIDPALREHEEIPDRMRRRGYEWDPAQVERDRVRGGKYDGMANWIFRRR